SPQAKPRQRRRRKTAVGYWLLAVGLRAEHGPSSQEPTANSQRLIFEGATWLTKIDQHQQQLKEHHPGNDPASVRAIAVHRAPAREDAKAVPVVRADGSFSAARRCASSAPRKLRRSTTKTFACSRSLWPRAARSCRAG